MNWPFFMYEELLKEVKGIQDEEEKQQEEYNKQNNINGNPQKMASDMMSSIKPPQMPTVNLPHF